jgi:predicted nucleic acid-binding protein
MGDIKAFVDSNVIINHFSGNINILELLEKYELYINPIVFSEVLMVYLKLITNEKSYTLKHKPELIVNKKEELKLLDDLFSLFKTLPISEDIQKIAYNLVIDYGLLPNDALILATCKHHKIKNLITLDNDFKEIADKEGIEVINPK